MKTSGHTRGQYITAVFNIIERHSFGDIIKCPKIIFENLIKTN